jgi:hypothetical protein
MEAYMPKNHQTHFTLPTVSEPKAPHAIISTVFQICIASVREYQPRRVCVRVYIHVSCTEDR